jgi:transposase
VRVCCPHVCVDDGLPSYEVLAELASSLRRELADALAVAEDARLGLAGARERTAELEARLKQSPRNSPKPPSSGGLGKPAPKPRSLRRKGGLTPGGQNGHRGTTLMQAAIPDRQVWHGPEALTGVAVQDAWASYDTGKPLIASFAAGKPGVNCRR